MSEFHASWVGAPLGEISHVEMGQSPDSRYYNDRGEGLPFYQGKADFGALYPTARKWCSQPTKIAQAGDILLSVRAPVGPTNLATEKCCVGRGLAAIRATPPLEQKYLLYFFRHIQAWLSEQGTGTTFTAVSGGFLRNLEVLLAPLNEQKRIADKLDAVLARVDACRERLDRVPAILKRFRQSVLAAATSGKLTEDWRESRGVMRDWREVGLGEIADVQGGITKDAKKQMDSDEEVPYLRVANVQRGYLDLSEMKTIRVPSAKLDELLLEPGDVLFNEGGDIDKVGRSWIWEGQVSRCTFQNHVFRARLFDKRNQPKYLSWWGNYRGLDYFLWAGKQTTNLASINKSMLSGLPVALPSGEEQAEIVRRVETLFAFVDRHEVRYTTARGQVERLIPALLANAFRGELVPQDPDDEPAAVLLERIRANAQGFPPTRSKKTQMRRANR